MTNLPSSAPTYCDPRWTCTCSWYKDQWEEEEERESVAQIPAFIQQRFRTFGDFFFFERTISNSWPVESCCFPFNKRIDLIIYGTFPSSFPCPSPILILGFWSREITLSPLQWSWSFVLSDQRFVCWCIAAVQFTAGCLQINVSLLDMMMMVKRMKWVGS